MANEQTVHDHASDAALLIATSTDVVADQSSVMLSWTPYQDVHGYNLYRSDAARPTAAARPVNGNRLITQVQNAAALRRMVPTGSDEWNLLASGFTSLSATGLVTPVDPGAAITRGLTPDEDRLFGTLAEANFPLRRARGLAFIDTSVTVGAEYVYELRGLLADGSELVLATDVGVIVGVFIPPDPPSGLVAIAGDHRVLTLWNRNPYADSFTVQRSTNPGGPFQTVNAKPVVFDMEQDLADHPITPPRPGFVDAQYWDSAGLPVGHFVDGSTVVGPDNWVTYYYRVASCDVAGRAGAWSAAAAATPVRTVPPSAPDQVEVFAQLDPNGLAVSWHNVTRDVDSHRLLDGFLVYRVARSSNRADLENIDANNLTSLEVATVTANPTDPTTPRILWIDTDPVLLPPHGETTFYYRIRCEDPYSNISLPSAIIGGRVPDRTPPGPTELVGAKGFADHLTVFWKPNGEPDLAGYLIYRGVCDHGWLYEPGRANDHERGACDLMLVGQVTIAEADPMMTTDGEIHFDDYSVPEGSPICYGYWVRAYDVARNLYDGNHGCPARREEYTCVRLREQKPPPAPVVTGLRARNNAVDFEWIAAPEQDLRAFHVYRSLQEFDPPKFLARVDLDGTISPTPWTGTQPSCADIPAVLDPLAAKGRYLDTTAEPHEVYWYRVSALDWLGNESESQPVKLPSSSTFTYTTDNPSPPVVDATAVQPATGCGLAISWTPASVAATVRGFVVFRRSANGTFRQVSPVVAGNTFDDLSARRSVDYWYCVQALDDNGRLTDPSLPVLLRY